MRAEVSSRGKVLKEGNIGGFTVMCDEGERLGGDGSAPMPLQYFFLSLGFCMLTQVTRNAEIMKVDVRDSTARVTGYLGVEGSVDEGTAFHTISGIDVELNIDTDAPAEQVAELVRRAEAMCFVTQAVRAPVDMRLKVSHNQQPLES
jgi:uncharacterized OsmC-like protein